MIIHTHTTHAHTFPRETLKSLNTTNSVLYQHDKFLAYYSLSQWWTVLPSFLYIVFFLPSLIFLIYFLKSWIQNARSLLLDFVPRNNYSNSNWHVSNSNLKVLDRNVSRFLFSCSILALHYFTFLLPFCYSLNTWETFIMYAYSINI